MRLLLDYRFLKFFVFCLICCYSISWLIGSFPSQLWQHQTIWVCVGIMAGVVHSFKVLNERVSALEQVVGVMILRTQQEKEDNSNLKA